MLINIFFKLVYITVRLVHASYSLPEWQAFKLTFFDPTCREPDPLYEPGNCKTMIRKQFSIFYTIISYKYTLRAEATFSRYELASTFRTPAHTAKM